MASYRLPDAVRLQIDMGGVPWNPATTIAESVEANWRRAYVFYDCGYADGLWIIWGALTGDLTATDLKLETAYAHTTNMPAGTLWLPEDLTPLDGTALDTTDINVFFDPDGAAGDSMIEFKCVARPEQVSPRMLMEGLSAAQIGWRWEIRDDAGPVIAT